MPLHDLIVRAGLVVDGQGNAPQTADIAVRDGHIAEIGRVRERAHRVIDADGALVIPGLVAFLPQDEMAEFDRNRQHHLAPGVTSAVERLPQSTAINEATRFLETSADGPFLVNRSFLLPHDALRQQVMGNKVRDQLLPSAGDIDQMADLLADGLLAGAIGLISALNGEPDELRALIRAGVQQCSLRAEIDTATTVVVDAPERDSGDLIELGRYLGNSDEVADVVVTTNQVLDDDKLISALRLQPAGTDLGDLFRHGTVIAGSNLNPLALLHAADPTSFPVHTVALRWADAARSFGLNDRRAIAVDRCADLNVLDHVHLNEDLSDGVVSTLVAGEEIVSFNELTEQHRDELFPGHQPNRSRLSCMEILRTPDDRFEDLEGFPFAPYYVNITVGDGQQLRVHYIDEGPADQAPVLLMHGEPTWSYLYRKMIPILVDAGHRVVVPDLVGFGRSDKPAAQTDYSYNRMVDWMDAALIGELDLRDITLFCQDWGGLIGLRLVAAHPDRFARVMAANTGLPIGNSSPPQAFLEWRMFSQAVPEFPTSIIVQGGCETELTPAELAAYEAPFPDESFKSGARILPTLVPATPEDPARAAQLEAWQTLGKFDRPFVTAFSDKDAVTAGGEAVFQKKVAGAQGQNHVTIEGGGHFLQEDEPQQICEHLMALIADS